MKSYIFLDVDGVLNCSATKERVAGYIGIEDSKVELLKELVDFFDAEIVLTSTWKNEWSKDKSKQSPLGDALEEKLSKYGMTIIDKTREIDPRGRRRGRGICSWLEENGPADKVIILDDEVFDYYNMCLLKHWVETEFFSSHGGLNKEIVDRIKREPERYKWKNS